MALYLDTETTGLHASGGDAIVEIAIVDERGVALINTLVNPNRTIPWHASNVHGLSDSMVRGMPDLNDLLPQIRKVISGQQLVIYNAPFDVSFFPNRFSKKNMQANSQMPAISFLE
jgi:DNA polymerase III epsilon subunit-like protein